MSVGVMEDYKLRDLRYAPHTHWVGRGTGTPKDKDDVDKLWNPLFFSNFFSSQLVGTSVTFEWAGELKKHQKTYSGQVSTCPNRISLSLIEGSSHKRARDEGRS
jgi:hypothetical protein